MPVVVVMGYQVSLVKSVCGYMENKKIQFQITSVLNVWYHKFLSKKKYIVEGQVPCSFYSHMLL